MNLFKLKYNTIIEEHNQLFDKNNDSYIKGEILFKDFYQKTKEIIESQKSQIIYLLNNENLG